MTLEQVSEALTRDQPPAVTQRHRPHVGRPDTFEVLYSMWTLALGPGSCDVLYNTLPEDVYGVESAHEKEDVEQRPDCADKYGIWAKGA